MQRVIFTIAARNYLAHVRCLMRSVERFHPEARRVLILADRPESPYELQNERFEVITSDCLDIPDSRRFHFQYNLLELCTAIKPYAARAAFERYDAEQVIYFDPDIVLYGAVDGVFAALESGHNIALTPHLLEPSDLTTRPSDLDILRSGVYNLGFLALSRTPTTECFLDWLSGRLHRHCVIAPDQGIFVDQKWMDLAPSIFPGVAVLRDPGLNVAYWNLHQRRITSSDGAYYADGNPLLFFHFSGFNPDRIDEVSHHQDRFTLGTIGAAAELLVDYRRRLIAGGYEAVAGLPAFYSRFDNGVPIPDALRRSQVIPETARASRIDPFSDDGYREYLAYWNSRVFDDQGRPSRVTRAVYRLYQLSPRLQREMPNVPGEDDLRLIEYMRSSGALPPDLAEAQPDHDKESWPPFPAICSQLLWAEESGLCNPARADLVEWFNQLRPLQDHLRPAPRLLKAIYEDRKDLRVAFPVETDEGYLSLLHWYLTSGRVEYGLDDDLLASAEALWAEATASLPERSARWRRQAAKGLARAAGSARRVLLPAGSIESALSMRSLLLPVNRSRKRRTQRPFGLNLIGDLSAPSGIGEAARSTMRAAREAGIPLHLEDVEARQAKGRAHAARKYYFNLFHCNADIAPLVVSQSGGLIDSCFNIAHWVWETETLPEKWSKSFRLFNEIWTPSRFCVEAIAKRSPVPVLRVPYCIDPGTAQVQPVELSRFGLSGGDFLFLCGFDTLSVPERKNPFGVIEAFKRAFPAPGNCRLVLKVNNSRLAAELMQRLREAAEGAAVTFVEGTLTRQETSELIAACDCLVSLHRAEGYGLMLAEAMVMDKPVICTNYSGNTDFATSSSAFLVDYSLTPVGPGSPPYDEDVLWAEPSVDDAARQMRIVRENPIIRKQIAEAGRKLILAEFSPAALGAKIDARLRFLYEQDEEGF